jgi:hypothetical protein
MASGEGRQEPSRERDNPLKPYKSYHENRDAFFAEGGIFQTKKTTKYRCSDAPFPSAFHGKKEDNCNLFVFNAFYILFIFCNLQLVPKYCANCCICQQFLALSQN